MWDQILTTIKAIPGAVKAVAELVGDLGRLGSAAVKIGTAKWDEKRQQIESRTESETALAKEHRKTR
jgi:hypothetical protein